MTWLTHRDPGPLQNLTLASVTIWGLRLTIYLSRRNLARVSGQALLERSLRKRRPGYDEYVARTSGFFPRPPRTAEAWVEEP